MGQSLFPLPLLVLLGRRVQLAQLAQLAQLDRLDQLAPRVPLDQVQISLQQIQSLLESCLATSQLQATQMMFLFLLLMTLTLTTGGMQPLNSSRQQLRDITMFHFMYGGKPLQ
jgi:hypothetical protein